MKHLGLFEGIGGFSLAAKWMGWETLAWCEWNEFGQKVLKHHFPDAEGFGDITKTDFTKYANRIDIITGGFPCQPFSLAGKRKGTEDNRHLWPEMLRAIREVRPKWVVGENVYGIVNWSGGLVFEQVQIDLENEGYEVQSVILPACAKNAPHRRDRIWFVAKNTGRNGCGNGEHEKQGNIGNERKFGTGSEEWNIGNEIESNVANSCNKRYTSCGASKEIEGNGSGNNVEQKEREFKTERTDGLHGFSRTDSNSNSDGFQRINREHEIDTSKGREYALNDISEDAMHSNGTSKPREYFRQEKQRQLNGPDSRNGAIDWSNFPTQPPICGGNDGIPRELDSITFPKWRAESIKAYGNAIVPQVAYEIFKVIEELNKL